MHLEDYGRRIVLDMPFDRGAALVADVLHQGGFHVVARVNVREELKRTLDHDFRQYVLLAVCSPETMLNVLMQDLAAGTALMVSIAVYELADGETVVVAAEPFEALINDAAWCRAHPELSAVAVRETGRLARALEDLSRRGATGRAVNPPDDARASA
jgi:uncharacterized protein (DUF302 family)